MTKGWTDQHKSAQAVAIKKWKPWEKSTGPRSQAGKATSSRNSKRRHGLRTRAWEELEREVMRLIRKSRELIERMEGESISLRNVTER